MTKNGDNLVAQYVALGIAAFAFALACYHVLTPRYQIVAADSHRVYRVNTKTGQITYYERGYSGLEEKARTAE